MKFLGSQIVTEYQLEFNANETAQLVACGAWIGPLGVSTVFWSALRMRVVVDLLDSGVHLAEDLLTLAKRLEPDLHYETPPTRRTVPHVHVLVPGGVALCTLQPPPMWREGHRWVEFRELKLLKEATIEPCEVCLELSRR